MARLPHPGGDSGNWGSILNDFLAQVHASDGTLKTDSVTSDAIAPNAVTSAAIAPNSITSTELASNSVTAATIADGSITNALIADGTIQETKLTSAVQAKLNQTAPVTSVAGKTGDVTLTKSDVGLGQVDNTSDATKNSATATLTNKTLTSPIITNAQITSFYDTNWNMVLDTAAIPSAVNHYYITNQSTGNYPTIGVDGSDTNIGITFAPKGNAPVRIYAPSGQTPTLDVAGPDTNIDLNLRTQNAGVVKANSVPVVTTTGTQTLTNKTISGSSNTLSNTFTLTTTGTSGAATYNGTTLNIPQYPVGDLVGPSSATDNAIVRFDTTTGKLVQNSSATIADDGTLNVSGTVKTGTGGVYSYNGGSRYIRFNTSGTYNDFLSAGAKLVINFAGFVDPQDVTFFESTKASFNPYVYIYGYDAGASTSKYGRINVGTNGKFQLEAQSGKDFGIITGGSERLTITNAGVVQANGVEVVTLSATQTLTNKTLADPVYTGQMVGGDYARTTATLHLKGGSGGTPILQMSRGSGVTPSNTFDFALAGGGFSIRDTTSGSYVGSNIFATSTSAEIYAGQANSVSDQSARIGIVSAGTHGSLAGTDVAGPHLTVQGGGGTGAGTPGDLRFRTYNTTTSGTTPQSATTKVTISGSTGVMTITTPGTVSGSVVSIDGTQTLTNKTLTTPVIDSIKDSNSNTILGLSADSGAVNYLELANSSSTFPGIYARGAGANVNIVMTPKGTGWVTINNSASTSIARFLRVSSAVNSWDFSQSATGQPIAATANGTDTNISVNLIPKGSGTVQANGVDVVTTTGTQTLTNKTLTSPTIGGTPIMPTGTTLELYNTADQTTNYEKGVIRYSSNVLEIGHYYGGTGSRRILRLGTASSAGSSVLGKSLDIQSDTPFYAFAVATSAQGNGVQIGSGSGSSSTAASGIQRALMIDHGINQSGTASYVALGINITENGVGSGTKRLIDAQVGGTSKFTVDNTGLVNAVGGLQANGVSVVTTTGTQTLTNKKITEVVYTITDGVAFEIDPANGSIQTLTLGAARTPKATNFVSGQSLTLQVAATSYAITWTDGTLNPTWVGGAAPTLSATQSTIIVLWKVSSTIYGSLVGYA